MIAQAAPDMAKITVLAGDFQQGDANYQSGSISLKTLRNHQTRIPVSSFESLETACKESVKKSKEAIGFGIAGAMLFGPVGAVAGYWLAGKETEITFMATLKGGRKLLAVTDDATYRDLSKRVHK